MEHDDLTTRLGRAPMDPTVDDAGQVDTCSYCRFPFDETDNTVLTFSDATTKEIARCPQCSGVHVRVITNSGWLEHSAGCPGLEIARTEPHPTEDNSPWGHPSCRHCTMPDPFTHLTGFVAGVVSNAQKSRQQIDTLQRHNTHLIERERETLRINADVHMQAAAVYNAVRTFPAEERAKAFADTIAVTHRYHGEILMGSETYNTLMEFGRVAFLRGVQAVRETMPAEQPALLFGSREMAAVQRLLISSWTDIEFEYAHLTDRERAAVDPDIFARLVAWIRRDIL